MDLTIPGGMGGKETIKSLLEIAPDAKAIVSSGYSQDPIMAQFKAYGFSGVVAKPYRLDELASVVKAIISSSDD
jgi:DNA-binding NarL/FixJ family response regulator